RVIGCTQQKRCEQRIFGGSRHIDLVASGVTNARAVGAAGTFEGFLRYRVPVHGPVRDVAVVAMAKLMVSLGKAIATGEAGSLLPWLVSRQGADMSAGRAGLRRFHRFAGRRSRTRLDCCIAGRRG